MPLQSKQNREAEKLLFIHPHKLVLFFVLAAISMAFLGVCVAYLYARVGQGIAPVQVPWIFLLNTVFLFLAARFLKKSVTAFEQDHAAHFMRLLLGSLVFTLLFVAAQFYAWQQMLMLHMPLTGPGGPGTGYLYAVSVLHLIHVVVGLPFLVVYMTNARNQLNNPVSELVYWANPHNRMYLQMLVLYWRYLDVLWVVLVLFLWVNQLLVW